NIILNFAFIYAFPSLGVINLAMASSLVFFMMFITLAINVLQNEKLKVYGLLRDFKFFYPKLILKMLRLGVPMGMVFTFESGFFVLGTFMAGLFGPIPLAAHHIAIHLCILTYMVIIGIANATSVMVSQAFGQAQFTRIRIIGRAGICLGFIWMSITSSFFILWPEPLIYLFTYFNQQEMASVFVIAAGLLMIGAVFQLFDGLQGIIFGILRGLEEGFKPMLIAIIGYWCIGAPFAYLFAIHWQWGVKGVWWGLASGLAATGLLGWMFFEWKIAKLRNTFTQQL
ncbi:MAG: MATE family efflux transporter, partial [Gammaproteobacteria bacterium]